MALTTLYFQRRDQRRAALREVRAPADVTGDNHKSAETINLKEQAEAEISPA
jgi:hypothetical protein